MSAHVVVIDSTARRATVKVTPNKPLSDVLQEACTKLGLNAAQYGLKNNNKPVDLSRSFRLSGLSSGAKLELVQQSRSPAVVSVALQLPESEAKGVPNGRLVDKFPSSTTLWLVLRKFEAGAAGVRGSGKNLTARGVPRIEGGGAGRLYYERPVLNIMGRELSSFTDLQKTLGQLGYNGGSVLIRMSFKASDTPLEEAMQEIGQYFKSVEAEGSASHTNDARGAHAGDVGNAESKPESNEVRGEDNIGSLQEGLQSEAMNVDAPDPQIPSNIDQGPNTAAKPTETPAPDIVGPGQRPMTIFAPSSSTTPYAARRNYDDADYEPTIDHAKLHQSRLSASARNVRLPSEAEIAQQREAAAQKLAAVSEVEIKIRYPDQTQVVSKFTALDTAATLYDFVRQTLTAEKEPFLLRYSSPKGPRQVPRDDPNLRLIKDLGLVGKVLVNFVWDENTSMEAKAQPALKQQFRDAAQEIKVQEIQAVEVPEEEPPKETGKGKEKETSNRGTGDGKKAMPKWLKLPGKK